MPGPSALFNHRAQRAGWLCKAGAGGANSRPLPNLPSTGGEIVLLAARVA
ncbi:MAG: hypothetical protein WA112_00330 [Rugosibacter sp.]